jgi:hypothetical protein
MGGLVSLVYMGGLVSFLERVVNDLLILHLKK